MANSNCWVQFWDKDYYDNKNGLGNPPNTNAKFYQKFEGPTDERKLEDVHWPGHPENNENNDYSSLITGPEAWVEVFSDRDFQGESYVFEPNSQVPKLSDVSRKGIRSWENSISSFKLHERDPLN